MSEAQCLTRLEERPIVTSTASPEEPVVKVLGVGYSEGDLLKVNIE